MLFTLEALQAGTGDSLILHFGDDKAPHFIVIDGGPRDIYDGSLKPRLRQLATRFGGDDKKINLDMVMVSHIDDDHIHGILDWMEDLTDGKPADRVACNIQRFWYNSFKDVIGRVPKDLMPKPASAPEAVGAWVAGIPDLPIMQSAAVVASFKQGNQLFGLVRQLGFPLNAELGGFIVAKDGGNTRVTVGPLKLTVLSPGENRLKALYEEWREYLRTHPVKQAEIAGFVDQSIYNLSSIVALAEIGTGKDKKTMLLTGDARGDDIIAGLKSAGLMKGDTFHVDLLKMPHHGSNRNVAPEFFRQITADHYVISANGEHDNPDIDTLKWLSEARKGEKYSLYFTNRKCVKGVGAKMTKFFSSNKSPGRTVVFRDEKALSLKVDLLKPVKY